MRRLPRTYPLAIVLAGTGLLLGCSAGNDASEPTTTEQPVTANSSSDRGNDGWTQPSIGSAPADDEASDVIDDDDLVMAFDEPDSHDFNLLLASETALVLPHPVEILNVEISRSDELTVSFEMESHYCFGVHSTVDETDLEVIVGIQTGQHEGIDPSRCSYGIYPYTTAIPLDGPLGDRAITVAETVEPENLPQP